MMKRTGLLILAVLSSCLAGQAQAMSDGFIRPATRAFTAIKESTGLELAKGPSPIDDRLTEADEATSTAADKTFNTVLKGYRAQKKFFNFLYAAKQVTAELKAEDGGPEVPAWRCAPLEDHDVCPSFQAAVKSILTGDRDLARSKDALEDCEEALASALKAKTFTGASPCEVR